MKRVTRAWPRRIVEVPSKRADPRADPQATQKISREMLDDALRRTKSGTRPAMRSEPTQDEDSFFGPRDSVADLLRIDSQELPVFGPVSAPPPPAITEIASPITPIPIPPASRLHLTPRLAFLVGLAVVAIVTLATVIGFLAGRVTGH